MRNTLLAAVIAALVAVPVPPALGVDYIRLSPSEFAEDLAKASALAGEGRYDAAIELLKPLIADEPDDADALSLMGYSLRKSGNLDAARIYYTRALAAEPLHPGANQYLGELELEQGRPDEARVRLKVLDDACERGEACEGRDILAAALRQAGP